mmetsp:Transcript_7/g.30  ORF Transcript_7/g.30 Transcript_7/m.30 type:complete len:299 (-) Transcript_7:2635-3531(-)
MMGRSDDFPPRARQLAQRHLLGLRVPQRVPVPVEVPGFAVRKALQIVAPVGRRVRRPQEDTLRGDVLHLRARDANGALPAAAVEEAQHDLHLRIEVDALLRVVKDVLVLVHVVLPPPRDDVLDARQELAIVLLLGVRLVVVVDPILQLPHHDGLRIAQQEAIGALDGDEPVRVHGDLDRRRLLRTRRQQVYRHTVVCLPHEERLQDKVGVAAVRRPAGGPHHVRDHAVHEHVVAVVNEAQQRLADGLPEHVRVALHGDAVHPHPLPTGVLQRLLRLHRERPRQRHAVQEVPEQMHDCE